MQGFESDLMIKPSRLTDPLCICAEECCSGELMSWFEWCVICENKGLNQEREV